jgi:hypothetical protein
MKNELLDVKNKRLEDSYNEIHKLNQKRLQINVDEKDTSDLMRKQMIEKSNVRVEKSINNFYKESIIDIPIRDNEECLEWAINTSIFSENKLEKQLFELETIYRNKASNVNNIKKKFYLKKQIEFKNHNDENKKNDESKIVLQNTAKYEEIDVK